MKAFRKNLADLNTVVFILYLFIVWSVYIFVYFNAEDNGNILHLIPLLLFSLAAIYLIAPKILQKLELRSIHQENKNIKNKKLVYIVFSGISFLILLIWYMAYYPGSFAEDSIAQLEQSVSGNYNDWHPVWHTMLFFTLPLKLTDSINAIILFQIIYIALVLGYMGLTVYELSNLKYACFSFAYLIINPMILGIAMVPYKDVAFAFTVLLAVTYIIRIYFSKGRWAEKKGRDIFLALALVNATLFRHNAILITGTMLIALFFHIRWEKWKQIVGIFIIFWLVVKYPFNDLIGVGPYWVNLTEETMGVPLTVIANVTKETPEVLDQETADFVYAMAPQEDWEEKYICGNYKTIKWFLNKDVLDETSATAILRMAYRCFKVSPRASFQALFSLTDLVYAVDGTVDTDTGVLEPYISENDFDIRYKGNTEVSSYVQLYGQFLSRSTFKYAFFYTGITNVVMLAVILAKNNLSRKRHWKKIGLCIPVFIYNFGTMFLLSGADTRYFIVSFLVCPMVVLLMMRQEEPEYDKRIEKDIIHINMKKTGKIVLVFIFFVALVLGALGSVNF